MAKSQVINVLVNTFSIDREWLQQFQASDLNEMLDKFMKMKG